MTSSTVTQKTKVHDRVMIVAITGAAGAIGYSLVYMIAAGLMLGVDQKIELRLIEVDIPAVQQTLAGVAMEINDCAFDRVTKIVCTSDYKVGFSDVDIAILVGGKPRGPGMERRDLLKANNDIFVKTGKYLDEFASRSVKVLVVANPANSNAESVRLSAPSLPPTAFGAMTRLDQNRAVAMIAEKVGCSINQVKNVQIWGNHSTTQYPWIGDATIKGKPARTVINDDEWIEKQFIPAVRVRGATIIKQLGKSSAMSAANAAMESMRDWILGTTEPVSMGIASDGSYDQPKGINFSMPITAVNGVYKIVKGCQLSDADKKQLKLSADELIQERKDVTS